MNKLALQTYFLCKTGCIDYFVLGPKEYWYTGIKTFIYISPSQRLQVANVGWPYNGMPPKSEDDKKYSIHTGCFCLDQYGNFIAIECAYSFRVVGPSMRYGFFQRCIPRMEGEKEYDEVTHLNGWMITTDGGGIKGPRAQPCSKLYVFRSAHNWFRCIYHFQIEYVGKSGRIRKIRFLKRCDYSQELIDDPRRWHGIGYDPLFDCLLYVNRNRKLAARITTDGQKLLGTFPLPVITNLQEYLGEKSKWISERSLPNSFLFSK